MNEAIYYDLMRMPGPVPSGATKIASDLGRRIVSSWYAPGSLIEDEARLSSRYEVSRSVIRDAVKILVGKGLLEVRRGSGTRVKAREHWGLLDFDVLAWSQSPPPDDRTIRNLLDVRRIIEPKAARWAAERGSPKAIAEIRNAYDEMTGTIETVEGFVAADAHFHRTILRATKNEFIVALEGLIFTALLNSIRLTNADAKDNAAAIPLHRDVCEAIGNGDGPRAEQAMETLLADSHARLEGRLSSGTERD